MIRQISNIGNLSSWDTTDVPRKSSIKRGTSYLLIVNICQYQYLVGSANSILSDTVSNFFGLIVSSSVETTFDTDC